MHLSDLAPLSQTPGTKFYALQKGSREAEPAQPPQDMPLVNLGPEIKDLTDLAAAMAAMDVLISVDTAPAHLAGAMGLPVWVMLPLASDWRWMTNRPDSPWYPTMRLFRQTKLHEWGDVIASVRDALNAPS